MSVKKGTKKQIFKKWWFWIIAFILICNIIAVTDKHGTDNSSQTSHIYDTAEVKKLMNGSRTKTIGKYSVIKVNSEKVSDEALTDWYFNYVKENDFNWCMILYSDKEDNSGVYANGPLVEKNVIFLKDEHGDYKLIDEDNAVVYLPTDDKTLEIFESEGSNEQDTSSDDFVSDVESIIPNAIGTEGESITTIDLTNRDLHITVDLSGIDTKVLSIEDLALSRASAITDEILELSDYDNQWDTITIDFGEIGKVVCDKNDVIENEYGMKCFPAEIFTLE